MHMVCNYNLAHKDDLVMSVKAPLDDDTKSHGVCLRCLIIWYYKNGFTKVDIRRSMRERRERRN
jgi:hypothetical protein